MKIYSIDEWYQEGERLFGKDMNKWIFKCCNCGNEQSMEDFIKAGIEEPESKAFFSCIGRWTSDKGTLFNRKSPCNYTLGGLIKLNTVKIELADKSLINVFAYSNKITKS